MNSIRETAPEPVYRWVIVSASALMLALSMGMMVNGTSVFFIPLFEEFGWQRGAVSLINTSGMVGLAYWRHFYGPDCGQNANPPGHTGWRGSYWALHVRRFTGKRLVAVLRAIFYRWISGSWSPFRALDRQCGKLV